MRIAQIAPLHERVPPKLYGGTERVVSFLTEELVRQGHDVTLFASGDSKTSAKLVRCCEMALRLNPSVRDALPYHMIMLDEVRRRIDQFDVLHFHIDVLHAPLVRDIADRTLTTLHGRLDLPDLAPFYAAFRELPLASISNDQQQYLRNVNWLRHHLPWSSARPSCVPAKRRRLPRIPWSDRAGEAARSRDRDRSASRHAAKDRRQGGSRRSSLLGGENPPDGRGPSRRGIHRRDRRKRQSGLPRWRSCVAVSDRLARALRAGHDRSDGVRHAGDRFPTRIGSRDRRGRRIWVRRRHDRGGSERRFGRIASLDRAKVRAQFERRFTAERMARDYLDIYRKLLSARNRSAQLAMLNEGRQERHGERSSRPDAVAITAILKVLR